MSRPSTELAVGAFAGMVDCSMWHWLDTLKVRAQDGRHLLATRTGAPVTWNSFLPPLRVGPQIVSSLYSGFSTNFALKVPYMAGMFACLSLNDHAFSWLEASQGHTLNTSHKQLLAAGLVGVEVSLLLSPFELVRIQGQNKGKGGLFAASRYVAGLNHDPSLRGFFRTFGRGLTPTMLREMKYSAGQFFLVGWIEKQIHAWTASRSSSVISSPIVLAASLSTPSSSSRLSFTSPLDSSVSKFPPPITSPKYEGLGTKIFSAMLGGFVCTIVSHPDDVIKTRMQTHLIDSPKYSRYSSYIATWKDIVRNEGFGALYKGALFRCCLRVPLGLSVVLITSNWSRPQIQRLFETV